MHPLIEQLTREGVAVTDGAWGTELQARGLSIGEFPDLWNIEFPSKVLEVARAYLEVGSRIILTNTFGANRIRLEETGRADEVRTINRLGVELSKEASGGRARVFASVGPSGKMLLNGDVTVEELRACFAEQCQALADAGAEALVIETMSDLEEAAVAVKAACETGLPVVGCAVFDSGKNRDRTMMGSTPEEAVEALARAGASVIGANCGHGIETAIALCRRMSSASSLPIWIKPNAGLPEVKEGRAYYRTNPEEFAGFVPALVDAGARFVGGCCGTSPRFIAAVSRTLGKEACSCD